MTRTYSLEVLNQPEDLFYQAAEEVDITRESLAGYKDEMQVSAAGLVKHLGAWVGVLRKVFEEFNPLAVEAVESGFNSGGLITFGIMHRVAEISGILIKDIPFHPDDFADSEPPDSFKSPKNQSVLDISMRGKFLPEKFPVIYKTGIIATARAYDTDQQRVQKFFESKGLLASLQTLTAAGYLAGAAEIVHPLERYAEVEGLERGLS